MSAESNPCQPVVDTGPAPVQPRRRRPKRQTETLDYLEAMRRMLRAAGRRVGRCDLEELGILMELRGDLDNAITVAVEGLRVDGYTWARIGEITGTTRQGAQQRWG